MRWLCVVAAAAALFSHSAASFHGDFNLHTLTEMIDRLLPAGSPKISSFSSVMSPCAAACVPPADRVLSAMQSFMNRDGKMDTGSVAKLCGELSSSVACVQSGCSATTTADLALTAHKLICVENFEILPDSISCIRDAMPSFKDHCEPLCSRDINSTVVSLDVQGVCDASMCALKCVREEVSKQCRHANSSLFDTLFDAFSRGQGSTFDGLLSWMLPQQCKKIPTGDRLTNELKNLQHDVKQKLEQAKKGGKEPIASEALSGGSQSQPSVEEAPLPSSVGRSVKKPSSPSAASTSSDLTQQNPKDLLSQLVSLLQQSGGDNLFGSFGNDLINYLIRTAPLESPVLVDGEMRIARIQMLDWQRNPVETPDIETVARLLIDQLAAAEIHSNRVAVSRDSGVRTNDVHDALGEIEKDEEKKHKHEGEGVSVVGHRRSRVWSGVREQLTRSTGMEGEDDDSASAIHSVCIALALAVAAAVY